jgi:hypothetical protein
MKLIIIVAYDIQGVPECHTIPQGQIVSAQYYSNFCSTTCVMQLGRSIQNWLSLPSSYVAMLQSTQQTLLRIFSNIGHVKFYNILPILLTSVHVTMI